MPIIKSAKKKLRQDISHKRLNKIKKTKFKEAVKTFVKEPTQEKFLLLQSVIDKITKHGLFKKNKADRLKSRFAKIIVQKEKTTSQEKIKTTKRQKKPLDK